MKHTINATFEIIVCLVVGTVIGLIIYWIGSQLHPYALIIGLVVGIGVFCWSLDQVFTLDWDDEEDE